MQEQDGDIEPAHHARRPMNAFLIFCKRHRSVVRDKYPNLENRSITKILGEWWANLDKDEKECYTGLAKQYKDAFFSANPDFKWYKLPAPPLRTLSSRPRDTEKIIEPTHHYSQPEVEKTNNNSTKVDFNKKSDVYEPEPKLLSMFTPGKLADEANMGGLSSLLATKTENKTPNPYYSPHKYKSSPFSEDRSQNIFKHKPNNILELQNALSETTRMFEDFDGDKNTRRYEYDQFTSQDVINKIVDKRYFKDDEYYHQYDDEDDKNSRSGRSCKGKRYQEFMAFGGLIVNKRQKRDNTDRLTEEYGAACSWDPDSCKSEDSIVTEEYKHDNFQGQNFANGEIKLDTIETPETDSNDHKCYTPADFDLDAKIRALPSLSLEKFQQRKRDNKRKKKTINLKPKAFNSSEIINSVPHPVLDERREMAERWRENVIGSQKRKPRKVSITRLKINSLVSSSDRNDGHSISPEIKLATEAPCTVVHSMDVCRQPSQAVDLLALATLAEVAANTSRIEEPTIHQNMTAKASD